MKQLDAKWSYSQHREVDYLTNAAYHEVFDTFYTTAVIASDDGFLEIGAFNLVESTELSKS